MTRAAWIAGVIVFATLFGGGISPALAAGYWTCQAGQWVAVGDPQHTVPARSCGSQLTIPRTQAACEQAGGKWGPAGLFPQPICRMPTRDAGRTCGDMDECEGECLAALTPAQRDRVVKREKLELLGRCTPHVPVFGCAAMVEKGFVARILCRD